MPSQRETSEWREWGSIFMAGRQIQKRGLGRYLAQLQLIVQAATIQTSPPLPPRSTPTQTPQPLAIAAVGDQ